MQNLYIYTYIYKGIILYYEINYDYSFNFQYYDNATFLISFKVKVNYT